MVGNVLSAPEKCRLGRALIKLKTRKFKLKGRRFRVLKIQAQPLQCGFFYSENCKILCVIALDEFGVKLQRLLYVSQHNLML